MGRRAAASVARVAARRELRCTGCGYGAVATSAPERCPMCGETDWQERELQPPQIENRPRARLPAGDGA